MCSAKRAGASRIVVCSSDPLRRDALVAYLGTLPDFTVIGRVDHTGGLVSLAATRKPDIVLIDAGRHPHYAAPTIRLIRQRFPATRSVLVYESLPAQESAAVHEAGAVLVPYADGLGGMLAALRTLGGAAGPDGTVAPLTDRQREIIQLMAGGRNVNEIGELLGISPGTVENHKRRVYAKLHCATATEAVSRAASLGLIDSAPPAVPVQRPAPPTRTRTGTVLAVVVGPPGEILDQVVLTLIRHRLPVVREHCPRPTAEVHWLRTHRGPVVRILVTPTAEHWWVGATLGWSAILVHDGAVDAPLMDRALARGVQAALSADHVTDRLVPVLHLVAAGYLVMDPAASGSFTESVWVRSAELPMASPALTPREHDILREIGRNRTVRQTARALGIALKTVENAQGHLFRKLGVHNRAAALAKAYSLGLLQPG